MLILNIDLFIESKASSTHLEFQIHVQALDPPTDVVNHCEHRLPNHVALFLLEEESHVHRDVEAQLAGVRQVPRVVQKLRSG